MTYGTADNATILIWFGAFVFASLAALTAAVFWDWAGATSPSGSATAKS